MPLTIRGQKYYSAVTFSPEAIRRGSIFADPAVTTAERRRCVSRAVRTREGFPPEAELTPLTEWPKLDHKAGKSNFEVRSERIRPRLCNSQFQLSASCRLSGGTGRTAAYSEVRRFKIHGDGHLTN